MNESADDILVRAALAGDTEPFCALVRRYQDHAYGVALGVLSDVHLALDAALDHVEATARDGIPRKTQGRRS